MAPTTRSQAASKATKGKQNPSTDQDASSAASSHVDDAEEQQPTRATQYKQKRKQYNKKYWTSIQGTDMLKKWRETSAKNRKAKKARLDDLVKAEDPDAIALKEKQRLRHNERQKEKYKRDKEKFKELKEIYNNNPSQLTDEQKDRYDYLKSRFEKGKSKRSTKKSSTKASASATATATATDTATDTITTTTTTTTSSPSPTLKTAKPHDKEEVKASTAHNFINDLPMNVDDANEPTSLAPLKTPEDEKPAAMKDNKLKTARVSLQDNQNSVSHFQRQFEAFVRQSRARRYVLHFRNCDCFNTPKNPQKIHEDQLYSIVYDDKDENVNKDCKHAVFAVPPRELTNGEASGTRLDEETRVHMMYFDGQPSLKIRCAQCILSDTEKNGRALITCTKIGDMKQLIATATSNKKENESYGLSNDHCSELAYLTKRQLKDMKLDDIEYSIKQIIGEEYYVRPLKIKNTKYLKEIMNLVDEKIDDTTLILVMVTLYEVKFHPSKKDKNCGWLECALDVTYPGGKRDLGETSKQCVRRETREETSLDIEEGKWKQIAQDRSNIYYEYKHS